MFSLEGFIAGFGSVLNFGWPLKQPYPIVAPEKIIEDDWQRISKDLNVAISKYKAEKNNGKA